VFLGALMAAGPSKAEKIFLEKYGVPITIVFVGM
jgi:hypothetical protein